MGLGAADLMVVKGVAVGPEVSFDLAVEVGCAGCTVVVGSGCCAVSATAVGFDVSGVSFAHCVRTRAAQIRTASDRKLLNSTNFNLYSFSDR